MTRLPNTVARPASSSEGRRGLRAAPAFTLASVLALALIAGGSSSPEAANAAAGGQAIWTIKDLGALSGNESRAAAINERGQIVGYSTTPGYGNPRHAFMWQNGKMTDLGTVGRDAGSDMPNLSEAVAVNDAGQVLGNGSVNQNTPVSYAFVWQKARKTVLTARGATDSGGQFVYSHANAINERGQVVGWRGTDLGYGRGRAFLWQGGRLTALGTLGGRSHSWARDVNERGQVVGESYSVDDEQDGLSVRTRAFLWENGRLVDLGVLPTTTESAAIAVNERGEVLGSSYSMNSGAERAFLRLNGKLVDLGALRPVALNDRGQVIANTVEGDRAVLWQGGKRIDLRSLGGRSTTAAAINERGQIVGSSQTKSGAWHAFLWQNGKMTDLGTLDGRRSGAVAINERGWVVGWSTTRTREHAVLWKPRA